jgi:hypothetical protein
MENNTRKNLIMSFRIPTETRSFLDKKLAELIYTQSTIESIYRLSMTDLILMAIHSHYGINTEPLTQETVHEG